MIVQIHAVYAGGRPPNPRTMQLRPGATKASMHRLPAAGADRGARHPGHRRWKGVKTSFASPNPGEPLQRQRHECLRLVMHPAWLQARAIPTEWHCARKLLAPARHQLLRSEARQHSERALLRQGLHCAARVLTPRLQTEAPTIVSTPARHWNSQNRSPGRQRPVTSLSTLPRGH